MYRYEMEEAQNVIIIPTAAKAPPITVTVRYEYLTDRMLDKGPSDE